MLRAERKPMLRAMFLAIGTFVALCGLLLFRVDRIVLAPPETGDPAILSTISRPLDDGCREIDPPGWLPYTLASTGLLTMLYSVAMPRRESG